MKQSTDTRPGTIYGLIDPRNQTLRYIGLTRTTLRKRLYYHTNRRYRCKKDSWIESLKRQGLKPTIVPIESGIPSGSVGDSEVFWIAFYRSSGASLLNMTDGGEFPTHSTESRRKISEAKLGRSRSEKTKKKISDALRGRKATQEQLRCLSIGWHMGPSAKNREAISIALRERPVSQKTREKHRAARLGTIRPVDSGNIVGYTHGGKRMSLLQWSIDRAIPYKTLYARVKILGWDIERALETPVRAITRRVKTWQPHLAKLPAQKAQAVKL